MFYESQNVYQQVPGFREVRYFAAQLIDADL